MATTKNVRMRQFNGEDYDVINPQTIAAQVKTVSPAVDADVQAHIVNETRHTSATEKAAWSGAVSDMITVKTEVGNLQGSVETLSGATEAALTAAQAADTKATSANTTATNAQATANAAKTTADGVAAEIPPLNSRMDAIERREDERSHYLGGFATTTDLQAYESPTENDFADNYQTGTRWIYKSGAWTNTGGAIPAEVTLLSDAIPKMNGIASAGSGTKASREDHIHAPDTSKADASVLTAHTSNKTNPHSVTAAQVGAEPAFTKGTAFNKNFSDTAPSTNGTASPGVAQTVARGDHVHQTDTSRAPNTLATPSVNGLLSAADKAKLDTVSPRANARIIVSAEQPSDAMAGDFWYQVV